MSSIRSGDRRDARVRPRKSHKTRRGEDPATPSFDEARLRQLALGYLNRFDASVNALRGVLLRKVRSEMSEGTLSEHERGQEMAVIEGHIDALLERFQSSGLVDDNRLARNLASVWRERGLSARAIHARLLNRGVPSRIAEAAIGELARDPSGNGSELDAAVAFAKRRRLGCFGPTPDDRAAQRQDLARMARAGFEFDIAIRALNVRVDEDAF